MLPRHTTVKFCIYGKLSLPEANKEREVGNEGNIPISVNRIIVCLPFRYLFS